MFKFPINIVTIEGPDLSGKTTLYREIHKRTKFRWNIQDRSFLSMICYARQYSRDPSEHRKGLMRELSNLNNRCIVMIPPYFLLRQRFLERGDDFQNEETLLRLRSIFCEEAEKIRNLPNVLVLYETMSRDALANVCINFLNGTGHFDPIAAGRFVRDAVKEVPEQSGTFDICVEFDEQVNMSDIMDHPREGKYYKDIRADVIKIINDEISGKNSYRVKQDLDSRRFYYSSNSCISSLHFLPNNKELSLLAVLRSTDVDRNASIDIKFLCHLMTQISQKFDWKSNKFSLRVRLNCAHIRQDLPTWDKNEVKE